MKSGTLCRSNCSQNGIFQFRLKCLRTLWPSGLQAPSLTSALEGNISAQSLTVSNHFSRWPVTAVSLSIQVARQRCTTKPARIHTLLQLLQTDRVTFIQLSSFKFSHCAFHDICWFFYFGVPFFHDILSLMTRLVQAGYGSCVSIPFITVSYYALCFMLNSTVT